MSTTRRKKQPRGGSTSFFPAFSLFLTNIIYANESRYTLYCVYHHSRHVASGSRRDTTWCHVNFKIHCKISCRWYFKSGERTVISFYGLLNGGYSIYEICFTIETGLSAGKNTFKLL